MQSLTQLISFIAAALGVYYILVAASFSPVQTQMLLSSVFSLVLLVNLLFPSFTALATRRARARLDVIYKGKANTQKINDEELERRAWDEIIALPGKYLLAELVTAYVLVVIPAVVFMATTGQATTMQSIHVTAGGFVSATAVVVQNALFLDRILSPVRRALLPHNPTHQSTRRSTPTRIRLVGIISSLILSAILTLGPLGYQKLLDIQTGSSDLATSLNQYLLQAGIIGLVILVSGIALALQLEQSVSQPVHEMISTMEGVRKGDFARRAIIITSDETAQLTIQLNLLLEQLQSARHELEQKVEERTAELSRKAIQLQTSAQIARDAAAQRDIGSLLHRTVDLVSGQFGFYHTGIFLVDDPGDVAILQAASSEGGKRMLERGHRLEVGRGIVGAAIRQNKPHVATDVGTDMDYFNNPDLPGTRSEAAIPLSVKGRVIGVLDIQSTEQAAFHQEDIQVLQSLADQIALAIQNARLIAESQGALQRLESATSDNMRRVWKERIKDARKAYRYTAIGITPLTSVENREAADGVNANKINIPITLRGQRIGNINLHRKGMTQWAEADRALAIEIANQAGLALENARLLEEAQRRAAQEQLLSDLTARLSRSLDIDTLLQTTLRELRQLPNATETSVYIAPPSPSAPLKKPSQEEG